MSAPRTLTGGAVQRLVAVINGLEVVQPGAHSCPADRNASVWLTFRAADGSVVARAVEHPTGCASVTLSVRGRTGPALTDSPMVTSELERLGAIPMCTGRQLSVAANPLVRDPGGDVLTLTFTNRSDSVCQVTGFPRLQLVDGAGRRLRVTERHLGSADAVPLDPGEAAWASWDIDPLGAPRATGAHHAARGAGHHVHLVGRVCRQAVRAVSRKDRRRRAHPGALM